MKIFTVRNGQVAEGAKIEKVALKGAGVEIDAITIGEEGRGRERGVLPVQGAPSDGILRYAVVGQTKAGKPKLIAAMPHEADYAVVVFRTEAGFRGGAGHTGDLDGLYKVLRNEWDSSAMVAGISLEEARAYCAANGLDAKQCVYHNAYLPFPGETICRGYIAQGDAGRMGGNEQIVAVVPAHVWFRSFYGGRLYGRPSNHYYRFDGERLIAVTWEERQVLEEAEGALD